MRHIKIRKYIIDFITGTWTGFSEKKEDEKNYCGIALAALLSVLVFSIYYRYSRNGMISADYEDIKDHAATAANIYLNASFWEKWLERPYMLWFLTVKTFLKFTSMPLEEAASFACALYGLACYWVEFFILSRLASAFTGQSRSLICAGGAAALSFLGPLYMSWFNPYQYEGQFTINPLFNATHMAVKWVGLLAFAAATDLIYLYRGQTPVFFKFKNPQKKLYVIFSVCLFASVLTKPTFAYMLIPAGICFVLMECILLPATKSGTIKKWWGFAWRIACACIPALVYLLIEFLAFYVWGDSNKDSHIAVSGFLEAWHIYSPNVPTSILLAMIFPIWMLLTNLRYFWQSIEGRLAMACYFVGTMEFSFFVETGYKLAHLNFSWEYMSGMLVLFVVSVARLIAITYKPTGRVCDKVLIAVGWTLLFLQLYAGLYYINPYSYLI